MTKTGWLLGACVLVLGCESIIGITDRTGSDAGGSSGGPLGGAGAGGTLAGSAGAGVGGGGAGQGGAGGTAGTGGAGNGGSGGLAGGGPAGASGGSAGTAGGSGTGGAGGASCLPTTGSALLRIGDLVPDFKRYNVCLKPLANPAAKVAPLLSAPGCPPGGLAYRDITTLFKIAPGAYEVKVIDGSATTCDGAGVASLPQALVEDGQLTAIYLVGDGAQAPTLKRTLESRPTASLAATYRFFHAAAGVPALDFGVASASKLPASLLVPSFQNVGFGGPSGPGPSPQGTVDPNGYLEFSASGALISFGAATAGTKEVTLALSHKLESARSYTIFEIGSVNKPAFPTQLLMCDETASLGTLAKCGNGTSQGLSVETWNAQLTGAFAPAESPRRAPILDRVPMSTSDVLCVTEIWSDADKDKLIASAKQAGFTDSYYAKTSWSTPVSDPKDASGKVPPPFVGPPCNNPGAVAALNTALDCLRDKCAVPLPSETSHLPEQGSSCISQQCLGEMIPLFLQEECWDCAFTQLLSFESIGATRSACTTDPAARLAFKGAAGAVLLSRYPIKGAETWVIPSTDFRGAVIRAPITLANGAEVDVYCSVLTTPATDCLTRPYAGQYGNMGATCKEQWANELTLQTQKLTDYVQAKSVSLRRRAVIAGEFYSGPASDTLKDRFVEAFGILTKGFAVATPVAYLPKCTFCNDNPFTLGPTQTPTVDSTWTSNIFLSDIPQANVKSAGTTFTEAVIAFDPGNGSPKVPLSTYYGFKSEIRIDP